MNRFTIACALAVWCAIILLAVAALSGCGGGGGGGGAPPLLTVAETPPVATPAPSGAGGCTIALWGDSIAALTQARLNPGFKVTGHAVVGGTAAAAQATFLQDPLAEDIIVLQYGMNDANSETPMAAPVQSMLDWAKAKGKPVVITGISRDTAGDQAYWATYNALLEQMAPVWANWPGVAFAGPSDLMPDGVHPNEAYQTRLADQLSAVLEKISPNCAISSK
jgi:hypothetical protein